MDLKDSKIEEDVMTVTKVAIPEVLPKIRDTREYKEVKPEIKITRFIIDQKDPSAPITHYVVGSFGSETFRRLMTDPTIDRLSKETIAKQFGF